jgi:hypothetical protein
LCILTPQSNAPENLLGGALSNPKAAVVVVVVVVIIVVVVVVAVVPISSPSRLSHVQHRSFWLAKYVPAAEAT